MLPKPLLFIGVTVEIIVFTLYGLFVRFDNLSSMQNSDSYSEESLATFTVRYPMMQDVHVMMFIGFGFLMTFLKHHSWSGVSINFISAALSIQLYILMQGFWHAVSTNNWSDLIEINIETFIKADYCAAAVLISFGAVIGKISLPQMLIMVTMETFIYALQEMIIFDKIQAIDAGGSITIHVYGAYFGLAFSRVFSRKDLAENPLNDSNYTSSLFAMIGTIFLWMHWPSFNAGVVPTPAGMHRAVVNTILSLTGSCISTFIVSGLYNNGKFRMEDILNATLAGGVVIGSACDVIIYPFTSLICGFFAGVVSTIGFAKISHYLEHKIGLFDTAGINNLHGMPGLLGGVLSAVVIAGLGTNSWGITPPDYSLDQFYKQGWLQIAATFTALGFGLASGAFSGLFLKHLPLKHTECLFEDRVYWTKCDPDPYEHFTFETHPLESQNIKNLSIIKKNKKSATQDPYKLNSKDYSNSNAPKIISSDNDE